MNVAVAKYINITLGVLLILMIALFMRGVLDTKYSELHSTDGAVVVAGESRGPGVGGRQGQQGGAARFAEYAPIVETGLFAPAGELIQLGGNIAEGTAPVRRGDSLTSLSLVGTVVGGFGAGGYGLFKDLKGNKQDIFKIGDMVFKVGRLKSVDKLSAVIVQSGKSYTLYMPKNSDMKTQSSPARQSRRPAPPFNTIRNRPSGRPPIGGAGGGAGAADNQFAHRVGEKEWTIDRRALAEALSDTGHLLTQARILPYRVDGKTKGFRLSSVQRTGAFALMGLRSGDILLKVNDQAIDSPEKGIQLLSSLGGETDITLDILRGGKPQKLNYEIR